MLYSADILAGACRSGARSLGEGSLTSIEGYELLRYVAGQEHLYHVPRMELQGRRNVQGCDLSYEKWRRSCRESAQPVMKAFRRM